MLPLTVPRPQVHRSLLIEMKEEAGTQVPGTVEDGTAQGRAVMVLEMRHPRARLPLPTAQQPTLAEEARLVATTSRTTGNGTQPQEIGSHSQTGGRREPRNMSIGMETFPNGMAKGHPENNTFGKSTFGASLPGYPKKNEVCAYCKS